MKKIITIPAVLIIALLGQGCKKSYFPGNKQMILFQFDYTNYAWGYQHYGYYIDSDGNIFTYNNPDEWNLPGNDEIISTDRLNENISNCSLSGKTISSGEILKYSKHINNIASTKVSAPRNEGADRGLSRYYCFTYDQMTGSYKGHLIKMDGDNSCENLNFYSKKVSAWMDDIRKGVIQK